MTSPKKEEPPCLSSTPQGLSWDPMAIEETCELRQANTVQGLQHLIWRSFLVLRVISTRKFSKASCKPSYLSTDGVTLKFRSTSTCFFYLPSLWPADITLGFSLQSHLQVCLNLREAKWKSLSCPAQTPLTPEAFASTEPANPLTSSYLSADFEVCSMRYPPPPLSFYFTAHMSIGVPWQGPIQRKARYWWRCVSLHRISAKDSGYQNSALLYWMRLALSFYSVGAQAKAL